MADAPSGQGSPQGLQAVITTLQDAARAVYGLNASISKTLKNVLPHVLVGNPSNVDGPLQAIPPGATFQFSGTALQTTAATGDVTWPANSFVTTISPNAVTLGMLAKLPADTLVGNNTGSTANAAALTVSQTMTLLQAASLVTQDQLLSGGANVTSFGYTTGSITVDCGKCPLQFVTNGGAFTITAPANDGCCLLLVTNNASAGAITFSGFTVGATGDAFDTTNGHKFLITIARINGVATYVNKALQ